MGKRIYTSEQMDYIRKSYQELSCKEISENIGLRESQTRYVIYKLLKVSLRKTGNRSREWSNKEIDILCDPNQTDTEKAIQLPNRTKGSVFRQRRRLGFTSKLIDYPRKYKTNGYWFDREDNQYSKRCRAIAELQLGRKLYETELVHHINGDKSDDRPENLYVCERNCHSTIHYQALEVIKQLMEKGIVSFDREGGKYVLCQRL